MGLWIATSPVTFIKSINQSSIKPCLKSRYYLKFSKFVMLTSHTLPLRKKRFFISENFFRTWGRTTKVLSCWRYRWLACVLSQVVRTSSPGSRPRQFFPSLPNPGMVSWSSWRNSSTASAEEFSYSFYYNEGLENKLTRALLLGLAKSIY